MKLVKIIVTTFTILCTGMLTTKLIAQSNIKALEAMDAVYPAEIYREKPNVKEVVEKLSVLMDIMQTGNYDEDRLYEMLANEKESGNWIPVKTEKGEILVKSIPSLDELRIINTELASDPKGKDIGEQAATEVAQRTMKQLEELNLLNRLSYNLDNAQTGYHVVGEGSHDGKVKTETITEYRVTFRPNIKGVELANAGVRIAVHRTGEITGLRLGGVSVGSVQALGLPIEASQSSLNTSFKSLIPKGAKARIAWARPMYVLPDDEEKSYVEPTMVYAYSLASESDGQEVISRRKMVGLSLTNGKPKIIDFSPPAQSHSGSELSRDGELDFKVNQDVQSKY